MIIDVAESTLPLITNPELRTYAGMYVNIYRDFMVKIRDVGLEIEAEDSSARAIQKMVELQKKGAVLRNSDKSIYVNRISPACVACQTGIGSATFFISLKCHRNCFFCFNPNQENYEYYLEHKRDLTAELNELRKASPRITHLALTGGEPLLYKEDTFCFFDHARELYPGVHTRLYTSGDHIDRSTLELLQKSGLQEIRFSIRLHDLARGQRHTFDKIALACEYIPSVMVEMPVLPDAFLEMKDILVELDGLGVFGINLLEFCFPLNNVAAYREMGYRVRKRPFRVLYDYWYAGGLPIAGSEEACLDLIEFALDAGLKLGVHYCSLENKHTGQIYQQNTGWKLPKHMYFSKRDYFLKTAKVFGDDVAEVKRLFDRAGYQDYVFGEDYNYLEFHVGQVPSLRKMDIEVGISSIVGEMRESERVLRELKLDVTTPKTLRLSKDI